MPDDIELLQFPYSNFNEKARWALDWKRLAHRRTNLLPGLHAGRIRKVAPETTVPVVRFGDRHVQGTAAIIEELERRCPEPPLYPADPVMCDAALEIQRWFDDEVGPAGGAATCGFSHPITSASTPRTNAKRRMCRTMDVLPSACVLDSAAGYSPSSGSTAKELATIPAAGPAWTQLVPLLSERYTRCVPRYIVAGFAGSVVEEQGSARPAQDRQALARFVRGLERNLRRLFRRGQRVDLPLRGSRAPLVGDVKDLAVDAPA